MLTSQDLRCVPALAALPDCELAALAAYAHARTYRRGEEISAPREACRWASLVVAGSVRIFRTSPEGRQLTLSVRGAGALFWFTSAYTDGTPVSQVQALEDETVIYMLPRAPLLDLLAAHPPLARVAMEGLSGEVGAAVDRLTDVVLRPIEVQLAHLLVQVAPPGAQPTVRMTHEELAGLLGASRERVGKALGHLRDDGLIAYGRGMRGIRLLRPERLREL